MRRPLVLLPLDDRPVNLDDVALLAREHGVELLVPPRPLLGHRSRPGDADALASWLLQVAPDAGGFVVSLDQLLYGGLVASRNAGPVDTTPTGTSSPLNAATAEATARRRLATLAALRLARPDTPILAFLVLPRTTTTVDTSADLASWTRGVDATAPPPSRRRNLALALAAVDEVAAGHLDWLSILQEDTSPEAAPRVEHEALARAILDAGVDDRTVLTTGADEAARVLVARLAAPADLTVTVRFASEGGADRVAPYEDRPLRATLAGQLRALGAREAPHGLVELWVHAPDQPGVDLCMCAAAPTQPNAVSWAAPDVLPCAPPDAPPCTTPPDVPPCAPPPAPETAPFLSALRARLREPDRPVAVLADTAHANGADPTLLSLVDAELAGALDGFAAWNTAANTLGCALAQGALAVASLPPTLRPRPFVLRRLADDGLYQTRVRPALAASAAAMGADPWCLGGPARLELERRATELLASDRTLATERTLLTGPDLRAPGQVQTAASCSAPPGSAFRLPPFAIELPWERLFEARLRPLVPAPLRSIPCRDDVDVIVAGGGISGVTAALAAARLGVRVTLVESSSMLGGSATRNLVTPWMGFHSAPAVPAVAGIAQEIVDALVAAGASPGHVTDPIGTAVTVTPFEPDILRMLLPRLLASAGVELLLHTRVVDATDAGGLAAHERGGGLHGPVSSEEAGRTAVAGQSAGALRTRGAGQSAGALRTEGAGQSAGALRTEGAGRITLVVHGPGGHRALTAPVVIDATGDAVVTHLLGVATVHGRPGDGATQPATLMIRLAGVDADLLARAQASDPSDVVLSDEARGLLPRMAWPAVAGFFSLVARAQADGIMGDFRDRVLAFGLPSGDWVVNMTRVTGLDLLDGADRAKAELRALEQAAQVVAFLRSRVPGFAGARLVGLGSALGVRETRHLVGRLTLTVDDILAGRRDESSVARGCFPLDLHAPDGSGMSIRHAPPGSWYGIPWGCLLPADGPPGLLITGRAISATHEASASARLAPTCMALGQAAGTGAALAIRRRCSPAGLDPADLRRELVAGGALV